MEIVYTESFESPIGHVVVTAREEGISSISFATEALAVKNPSELTARAVNQLQSYFAGERQTFDLALVPEGSDFEQTVWQELQQIAFGSTISYATVADRLKNPKAIRAVGRANGANPIAIVIPCHRVIGADGSLTGYAGELWRKRWLLDHEAKRVGTILL